VSFNGKKKSGRGEQSEENKRSSVIQPNILKQGNRVEDTRIDPSSLSVLKRGKAGLRGKEDLSEKERREGSALMGGN